MDQPIENKKKITKKNKNKSKTKKIQLSLEGNYKQLNLCQVAVNCPLRKTIFTYLIEPRHSFSLGDVIKVPFNHRQEFAIYLGDLGQFDYSNSSLDKQDNHFTFFDLQFLDAILGKNELSSVTKDSLNQNFISKLKIIPHEQSVYFHLTSQYLQFLVKIAKYYHYPFGKLIFDVIFFNENHLSALNLKRKAKIENLDLKNSHQEERQIYELNDYQLAIKDQVENFKGTSTLVHGITGSGKSYIFLEIIKSYLKLQGAVLFLVPEINLTPQFIQFFTQSLSCEIIVYHGELTHKQKAQIWKMIADKNNSYLVLSTRSGVFYHFKI